MATSSPVEIFVPKHKKENKIKFWNVYHTLMYNVHKYKCINIVIHVRYNKFFFSHNLICHNLVTVNTWPIKYCNLVYQEILIG